jgi:glycosyltransferase involved in cell wall biosynthesis
MKAPQVSVLMPCYNAAETISETLDSLFAQTHSNFEIVAVDDGSEDATLEIIQRAAQQDPRLKPIVRPHEGIIPALNSGLAACQAEYVARMDADDLAHPERLKLQTEFLEAHSEIGLVAALIEGFPQSELRGGFHIYIDWLNSLVEHEQIMRERFVESPFAHPSVMFRKSVVQELGGYQEHGWAEDYDLWLRMAAADVRFAKLSEVLVSWRDHPPRLTRTDSRYSLSNFLRAKAHYLMRGPLIGRECIIIWGSGMMGRRISKYLLDEDAPITAFVDIDPKKIGRTRRGKPIISIEDLANQWPAFEKPIILAAVGARGARKLIRASLEDMKLEEGRDWYAVA